jgi:hypothetical protein
VSSDKPDSLLPRGRVAGAGPSAPAIIEGDLRPEINSAVLGAWSEASFEGRSGRFKIQQKLC